MIIAIDGLNTNGKTTMAKMISRKMGFKYYNSGAVYRCITLVILRKGLDINDIQNVISGIQDLQVDFDGERILLNGEDVSELITTEEVSDKAASWSNYDEITQFVRQKQRAFLSKNNTVIEGRDIGTRIAPNADIKFYLYSDIEARAQRYWLIHQDMDIGKVKEKLLARDRIEIEGGSFVKPQGAIEIDTTYLSIAEVYERMMADIKKTMEYDYDYSY